MVELINYGLCMNISLTKGHTYMHNMSIIHQTKLQSLEFGIGRSSQFRYKRAIY